MSGHGGRKRRGTGTCGGTRKGGPDKWKAVNCSGELILVRGHLQGAGWRVQEAGVKHHQHCDGKVSAHYGQLVRQPGEDDHKAVQPILNFR